MSIRTRVRKDGSIRYDARIKWNRETIHLGTFDDLEEARRVERRGLEERPQHVYRNRQKAADLIGAENVRLLYRNGLCITRTKRR